MYSIRCSQILQIHLNLTNQILWNVIEFSFFQSLRALPRKLYTLRSMRGMVVVNYREKFDLIWLNWGGSGSGSIQSKHCLHLMRWVRRMDDCYGYCAASSHTQEKIRTDNEENVLFIIYLLPYGKAIKLLLIYDGK